jgi:hypothetical protein
MGVEQETRVLWVFPVCIAAMIAGSLLGQAFLPETRERRSIVDELLLRTRMVRLEQATPAAYAGIIVSVIAFAAFIGCAFLDPYLPKPGSILINMAIMMIFVGGCYLATPAFVPETGEARETPESSIERSWIHLCFGSGWAWLALYAVCGILVLVLYFW